jgi:hypothetical protein
MSYDSAGIVVVENAAVGDGVPVMTVDAQRPLVVIGRQSGDSLFSLFRVLDARMLSDNRIVVANGPELLWFSRDGLFLNRAGGRGSGPSEFRAVAGVEVLPEDTVVAFDRVPPSAKYFGPSGDFVKAVRFPPLPLGVARVASGAWIGLQRLRATPPQTTSEFTEDWFVVRHAVGGEVLDTIVLVSGERYYGSVRGSVRIAGTPRAYVSARGDRIVAASSATYAIDVFDSTGTQLQVIRNRLPNPAYVAASESETQPPRSAESGSLAGLDPPVPEHAPAFDRLLLSNAGELWVRRDGCQTWHVYGRTGALTASAWLPPEFRPTEIGEGWLLGVWTDELDTESIRLFELIPS